MRIKRFKARDIASALKMVKSELGPEAVILSTREIKDHPEVGVLVEVTAGVEYHPDTPAAPTSPNAAPTPSAGPDLPDLAPSIRGLEGGLAELKELILDLTHQTGLSDRIRERPALVRIYRHLVEADLDAGLARTLVESVSASHNGANPAQMLQRKLSRLLQAADPIPGQTSLGTRHVVLIGPSGVGKTTTLAKLAARWSVKEKKRVGLISVDTFRLGAAEQLRTYARIMGLPVRVAQDKAEFEQAVELFEGMDVVLVDTSGRSLQHPDQLAELTDMTSGLEDMAMLLVLSAGAKDRDLAGLLNRTSGLPVQSIVISKIDETEYYGNVINNLVKFKKPVSFLTNGQKVPDDIIRATPERLAKLMTSGSSTSWENS